MPRRTDTDTTTEDDTSAAVANPPAGGDQTQASTNDDNQNTVLRTAPYVVVVSANRQAGVVSRFADQADADNDAAARRKALTDTTTKVTVLKESDLPEFVVKVEAGENV